MLIEQIHRFVNAFARDQFIQVIQEQLPVERIRMIEIHLLPLNQR